ncbi:hypothetical protein [Brevundimonas vesicularis]|uniref:hypothetical protein n=1 Tax=Brevundimonas vesicularis TaxID=41276 RepID=UPI0038D3EA55
MIALSPSGDRLARVQVVDGQRVLVVSRIGDGHRIYAGRIGEAKVRGLSWVGEDHVLIYSSQTRSVAGLGIPRSELSFGNILSLETGKLAHVLERTPEVLATPYGAVQVRHTSQGPMAFARGFNVLTGDINLYRIDLDTGQGRSVQSMKHDIEHYVLDPEGEVIALSEWQARTGRWSLRLPAGWRFTQDWTTTELIEPPFLYGLGRTPRTIIVNALRPDLNE